MIKIDHVETYGWEAAIRGMRNPMNSWDKSDSYWGLLEDESPINPSDEPYFFVGDNDLSLMKKLVRAGSDHRKFLRQIFVSMDITAPLYWWKEYDTYKVGTVANSCSTMHKIHDKEFTREDFSFEHTDAMCAWHIESILNVLNTSREKFLETKDKGYWWNMIQFLPSSYNQLRTVTMNYEVLLNMYNARKDHKLDEWRKFCDTVADLPYFKNFIDKGD